MIAVALGMMSVLIFGVLNRVLIKELNVPGTIATVMLAARFDAYLAVVAGTTLGMMLANVPVVWLGERMTRLVPLRVVHIVSAVIFLGLGLFALFG